MNEAPRDYCTLNNKRWSQGSITVSVWSIAAACKSVYGELRESTDGVCFLAFISENAAIL